MKVRKFIETANCFGQQVIKIDDANCKTLIYCEIRSEKMEELLDKYGSEEIDFISSDIVTMVYGDTDCITLHLTAEDTNNYGE